MSARRKRLKKFLKLYCPLTIFTCTGYTKQGKGIISFNGKEFYVDELLLGEQAYIQIYYEDVDFGIARAALLIKQSPDRILPLGHWKFQLGSYHLSHMNHQAQDAFKQNRVQAYWPQALPIIVGKRTNYRNKVSLTNGGFMAPGPRRKKVVIPEQFDLMELDFSQYASQKGVYIVRRLKTTIEGKPGTKIYAQDEMLGKKFRVGLDAFYQVNTEMAQKAYATIKQNVPHNAIIFDLFSGGATIGIHLSDKAKQVYAVEINRDSHQDALNNIALNHLKNVSAILGDANQFVLETKIKPDVIVVDPARAGLSETSAKAMNQSGAAKIIYLSCNIDTQFRDLAFLTNYQITKVQPYDFFPQTFHIENLIILIKK